MAAARGQAAQAAQGAQARCVLQLTTGQIFEEALEFTVDWPDGDPELVKEQRVEMVLDRAASGDTSAKPMPAKGAVVKTVDIDVNSLSRIQNMPSGRNFLIRAVAVLRGGGKLCSEWVRTQTTPETQATVEDSQDINGLRRGKCKACPCKGFRWDRANVHLNSTLEAAICRGCACASTYHEVLSQPAAPPPPPEPPVKRDDVLWRDPASVRFPKDAASWDQRERDLFVQSSGRFHPREMVASLRRTERPLPATAEDVLDGRISVVCPTTDARHEFHEQLVAVFEAQQWEDKELVVVETWKEKPSAVLQAKSKSDERIIYVSFKVDADHDWSIGLKRNIGTHLASGNIIANFDDDDLYAPAYLRTMLGSMVDQRCEAITLSCWYVFDVNSSKFGIVDAKVKGEDWLYGYGFSYVFMRRKNLEIPYPDCNMGEDFKFFSQVRKIQWPNMFGAYRHVALFKDEDGICCHTLHPKATSGSYAKAEVPPEEVCDLGFAELGLMDEYMSRFPRTAELSKYIRGDVRRIERNVKVWSSFGQYAITCHSGSTLGDVQELVAEQLKWALPETLQLHLAGPKEVVEKEGKKVWAPEGSMMLEGQRIGRRTSELWVTLPVDRGDPPEVEVRIVDLADANIGVNVQVHRMLRLDAVRSALLAQHTRPGREAQAKAVRLAEVCTGGNVNGRQTFMACDTSEFLGERRRIFARSLAEMLGRTRRPDPDGP